MSGKIGVVSVGLMVALCLAEAGYGQGQAQRAAQTQRSRRSQRVGMKEVQVASPDGKVKFTLLPNAERLTYTVTLGEATVIEPSPLVMNLDGYDLSAGVIFGKVERYEINETYPWYGAQSTAVNQCAGGRISLVHDLTLTGYTLEVRVFNDGVAFRHVIPGEPGDSRVPDEYSAFVVPAGSTVWYGGMVGGHYETDYQKKDIAAVGPGEWAGPPLTIAANPQSIVDNAAVEVIKSIPSVWDQTMVLPGSEIGELAVYARRSGGTWFLAVMCGPRARTIQAPLSFLGDGRYKASLVRDDMNNDAAVKVESATHQRSDSLAIEMRAGGGFVASFVKE